MVNMNIFLDTNIWLRYFIGDNENQRDIVETILQKVTESEVNLCTSSFVLSEFIYVESSFYKITKTDILEDIEAITSIKNLWLIEKTNLLVSIELYKKSQSKMTKWSDCMIVTQIPEHYSLCSFDTRLEKLIGKHRFTHPSTI